MLMFTLGISYISLDIYRYYQSGGRHLELSTSHNQRIIHNRALDIMGLENVRVAVLISFL
jgi:hypothetical protein